MFSRDSAKGAQVGMREESYQEYEAGWRSILRTTKALAAQNGPSLERVLNLLQQPVLPNENAELLDRFGYRLCGARVKGSLDYYYETPLFELQLQNELLRAIDPDTVNIVELGSGYSKNLFRIWLNGGPLEANYVAGEYTEAGRECGRFLASLEPRIRYQSVPFDYYTPAFTGFDTKAKTFAFSSSSVEQIPEIDRRVFDALLAIPGLYRVVHVEPVGWQRKSWRIPLTSEWSLWRDTMRSALELRYNTNLLSVIESLENDKKITVNQPVKFDFLSHRPNLPGTVIAWEPGFS
jgi:hypothetical protein